MASEKLKIGDPVPELAGFAVDGTPIDGETIWAEGPTLLTFLRHFG